MTIALYLDTETDRQNREQGETERKREGGREEGERENSNSKTLILKDNSVRSIWTYLQASPCYTANTHTKNTTIPQTNIISMIKQLINAV